MTIYIYFSATFAEPVLTAYADQDEVNARFDCQLEQNEGKGYEVSENISGKHASLDNGKDAAKRWSTFGYRVHQCDVLTDQDEPYVNVLIDGKEYQVTLAELNAGYKF